MGATTSPNRKPLKFSGDRCERLEKFGDGGMGVVWRGRDLNTGGVVAIKITKDKLPVGSAGAGAEIVIDSNSPGARAEFKAGVGDD